MPFFVLFGEEVRRGESDFLGAEEVVGSPAIQERSEFRETERKM